MGYINVQFIITRFIDFCPLEHLLGKDYERKLLLENEKYRN